MPTGGNGSQIRGGKSHQVLVDGKSVGPTYARYSDAHTIAQVYTATRPGSSVSILDDEGKNIAIGGVRR